MGNAMGIFWSSTSNDIDIENEAKEIEALLYSAKTGQWKKVWDILGSPSNPRKGYLINVIPQSRRWGVLHQAVYWKDPDILRYLLQFPSCDSDIKAKKCSSECGETGQMNAHDIANKYEHKVMSKILSEHKNIFLEKTIPTFQPYNGYCDNDGLGLLSITLASYKPAFHPSPVDANKSVFALLLDIFEDICRVENRWRMVKEVVADSVYALCSERAEKIQQCNTRDEFFKQIIQSYTDEDNKIYSYINLAFRRQNIPSYSPSGDDLAIGPFCVICQMLLLYWSDLEKENQQTFRKMVIGMSDANKYTKRTRFVWQSIVSSALDINKTSAFPTQGPRGDTTVLFTIDNSTACMWQPRNIEKHATYRIETERTYPAGAKFLVTDREYLNGEVHVNLKLLAK